MDSQFVGGVGLEKGKVEERSSEHSRLHWFEVVELGPERDVPVLALSSLR